MNLVLNKEALELLKTLESGSIDLIYIDPPFNTKKKQQRVFIKTTETEEGTRKGFLGKSYSSVVTGKSSYEDSFEDYIGFLKPIIEEIHRVLKDTGSFFFHIDYREVHYCKVLIDTIFGRSNFRNEIIWAYDYGARSKNKWPAKHDNILWYTKSDKFTFNYDEMDRIPYMAPKLVGEEKASIGKTPTDVWWHTIVSPTGKEKVGYATQKPLGILKRIIKIHSNKGDLVADFFAGSGSFGHAAALEDRKFIVSDMSEEAFNVMKTRLKDFI